MIKIGIDPSTKVVGWAMFFDDKLVWSGRTESHGDPSVFGEKLWDDINGWDLDFVEMRDLLSQREPNEDIYIAVELSEIPNFGRNTININTSIKLAIYAGAIMNELHKLIRNKHRVKSVKFISPNQWQNRIGTKMGDRHETKLASIQHAQQFDNAVSSDDEADAINIAYLADVVEDTQERKSAGREKKIHISALIRDVQKTKTLLADLKARVLDHLYKKGEFNKDIVWWEQIQLKAQKDDYKKWSTKLEKLEADLKERRNS